MTGVANEKLSSYVFPCTRAHPVLNAVIPKKDVPGSRIHYVLVHDVFFDESERGATLTRSRLLPNHCWRDRGVLLVLVVVDLHNGLIT